MFHAHIIRCRHHRAMNTTLKKTTTNDKSQENGDCDWRTVSLKSGWMKQWTRLNKHTLTSQQESQGHDPATHLAHSCPRCWISIPEGYNVSEPKASTFDNNSLGLQSNMACWKIPGNASMKKSHLNPHFSFGNFLAGMFDYQTVGIYIYINIHKHLYQAWLITHWYNNIRYAMVFPYIIFI